MRYLVWKAMETFCLSAMHQQKFMHQPQAWNGLLTCLLLHYSKNFWTVPTKGLRCFFLFSCKITDLINGTIKHLRPKAECGTLYTHPSFKLWRISHVLDWTWMVEAIKMAQKIKGIASIQLWNQHGGRRQLDPQTVSRPPWGCCGTHRSPHKKQI